MKQKCLEIFTSYLDVLHSVNLERPKHFIWFLFLTEFVWQMKPSSEYYVITHSDMLLSRAEMRTIFKSCFDQLSRKYLYNIQKKSFLFSENEQKTKGD